MNKEDKRYISVVGNLCRLSHSVVASISFLAQDDLDRLAKITNNGSDLVPAFSEVLNLEKYVKEITPIADKFGYKY